MIVDNIGVINLLLLLFFKLLIKNNTNWTWTRVCDKFSDTCCSCRKMPEGPEIKITSDYINNVCEDVVFTGPPRRSTVTKNPEVPFGSLRYSISAESRGKELALFLNCQENPDNKMRVLFRFGMSGRFIFTPAAELHKHSHLSFVSVDTPPMALSFVDTRRFGSWQVSDEVGQRSWPRPNV